MLLLHALIPRARNLRCRCSSYRHCLVPGVTASGRINGLHALLLAVLDIRQTGIDELGVLLLTRGSGMEAAHPTLIATAS